MKVAAEDASGIVEGKEFHSDTTHSSFSNVELSYCWKFYRPIIEPPDTTGLPGTPLRHEDDSVASGLIESCHTPFSVRPHSGSLLAGRVKKFVFQFIAEKVTILVTCRFIHVQITIIYLSIYLSTYLSIYISIYLSICLKLSMIDTPGSPPVCY